MKKVKFLSIALILVVGMFFGLQSCQNENFESIKHSSNNKVSIDLARQVALNFSRDDAFIRDSIKQDLKVNLRSNRKDDANKTPFPGFEEKDIDEILTYNDINGETALYVIKFLPNGYVIIPATIKETPILAFSNDGIFDQSNIPNGLSDWIDTRTNIVEALNEDDNYEIPEEVTEGWLCYAPPEDEEIIIQGATVNEQVGPILATRWGQGHGYNYYCPQYGCSSYYDGRAVTGCVATAMAQVIRAWNYPANYNYSIMPNQIAYNDPITSNTNEVARLMHDCGVAANMDYNCAENGGSGTSANNMINA